jgi:hypothetical protein
MVSPLSADEYSCNEKFVYCARCEKEKSFMNMRTYRLKINFQSAAQSFLSKGTKEKRA